MFFNDNTSLNFVANLAKVKYNICKIVWLVFMPFIHLFGWKKGFDEAPSALLSFHSQTFPRQKSRYFPSPNRGCPWSCCFKLLVGSLLPIEKDPFWSPHFKSKLFWSTMKFLCLFVILMLGLASAETDNAAVANAQITQSKLIYPI